MWSLYVEKDVSMEVADGDSALLGYVSNRNRILLAY